MLFSFLESSFIQKEKRHLFHSTSSQNPYNPHYDSHCYCFPKMKEPRKAAQPWKSSTRNAELCQIHLGLFCQCSNVLSWPSIPVSNQTRQAEPLTAQVKVIPGFSCTPSSSVFRCPHFWFGQPGAQQSGSTASQQNNLSVALFEKMKQEDRGIGRVSIVFRTGFPIYIVISTLDEKLDSPRYSGPSIMKMWWMKQKPRCLLSSI